VRKLVIMLALWVAFIPVTRPDGTITYLSTGWVQTVAPVTGGSGCTKTANTVVRLSGEIVCVVEDANTVWRRLQDAESKSEGAKP
jgi:hypothetical protein